MATSDRWPEVERRAARALRVKAHWRAWEMEMRGRAVKARLASKLDSARAIAGFYGELFGVGKHGAK